MILSATTKNYQITKKIIKKCSPSKPNLLKHKVEQDRKDSQGESVFMDRRALTCTLSGFG
jgi:hypothetical protein